MATLKSILLSRAGCQSEWGILSRQSSCQETTARHRPIPKIPGFGVVFQQDGALAHRARDTVALLQSERCLTSFLQPCGRRIMDYFPDNAPTFPSLVGQADERLF